jgi:hypothetical protein
MARKARRLLAQRRREHERGVRRGRYGADFSPSAAADEALREPGQRIVAPRGAPADIQRLRGIPMIGGAAGAIPGTLPHRNRRLERWREALAHARGRETLDQLELWNRWRRRARLGHIERRRLSEGLE